MNHHQISSVQMNNSGRFAGSGRLESKNVVVFFVVRKANDHRPKTKPELSLALSTCLINKKLFQNELLFRFQNDNLSGR